MYGLVSIIMPCYNAEAFIDESITSVLQQTYANWELIIIDDCSKDKCCSIIENYSLKDSRISLTENTNNIGVALSRNKAIKKAKGIYIAFLDSDDIWLPEKLTKQLKLMHNEGILLSYSAYHTIDTSGKTLSLFKVPLKLSYDDMLKTSSIGTLTTIYNAKSLGKIYLTNMGHEDYVMKLEILKKIPYAKGIEQSLGKYRLHPQSLSVNKLTTAKWQWNIYRKVEKLSWFKSCYYFVQYAYHGVRKYR